MAVKANNQLTETKPQEQKRGKSFAAMLNAPATRGMIEKSIGDPTRAAAFIATLIAAANANPAMKECEPSGVIAAALRGEIAMGLSLSLGEYSIVPYTTKNGKVAQFQLGAHGLKQICVRSGAYKKITIRAIRDGAFAGYDEYGDPMIDWAKNNDTKKTVIGYYGAYVLKNGFSQSIYWTHDEIMDYADRYAKAFSLETYNDLLGGKITGWDAKKLRNGSPWYAAPDELPHQKMCLKTIAKQLLNDGLAPKEVLRAIRLDDEEERNPGSFIPEDMPADLMQDTDAAEDGSVIDGQLAEESAEPDAVADAEEGFFG